MGLVKKAKLRYIAAKKAYRSNKSDKKAKSEWKKAKRAYEEAKINRENAKKGNVKIQSDTNSKQGKKTKSLKSEGTEDVGNPGGFVIDRKGDTDRDTRKAQLASFEVEAPVEEETKSKPKPIIRKEIGSDTISYFRDVTQALEKDNFQSAEDRELLIGNVFDEIKGMEVALAGNRGCSAPLERVLHFANNNQVLDFLKAVTPSAHAMAIDRCASHVLETSLKLQSNIFFEKEDSKVSQDMKTAMESAFCSICEQLNSHWLDLFFDRYGSHIVRTIIKICMGCRLPVALKLNPHSDPNFDPTTNPTHTSKFRRNEKELERSEKVPKERQAVLDAIFVAITKADDETVEHMAFHQNASPVVQHLLECLPDLDESTAKSFISRILFWASPDRIVDFDATSPDSKQSESIQYLHSLLRDRKGSHLIEKIIKVAPPSTLAVLYSQGIRGSLGEFALHAVANYPIQKLLAHIKDKPQAQGCFEELEEYIPRLFECNRIGVIWRLCESLATFKIKQKPFLKKLKLALSNPNPSPNPKTDSKLAFQKKADREVLLSLLHYNPHPNPNPNSRVNVMGSCIVQCVIGRFESKHGVWFAKALADMSGEEGGRERLVKWACDPAGSRVLDVFLASNSVPSKLKQKLIGSFLGGFATLGMDTYGSFCAQKCYGIANIANKRKIAQELLDAEKKLQTKRHGQILLTKCRVRKFKEEQLEWEKELSASQRKLELFADFLDEGIPNSATPQTQKNKPVGAKIENSGSKNKKAARTLENAMEIESLFKDEEYKATKKKKKKAQNKKETRKKRVKKEKEGGGGKRRKIG